VTDTVTFRALKRFNDPALAAYARERHRLGILTNGLFDGTTALDRLARALGDRRAISLKEFLESCEFYARTRRRVREPQMADLCCGHGLTGILFALFEKRVERVTLMDRSRPASHSAILEAACTVGPWVEEKVTFVETDLARAPALLEPGTSIVAVHACGTQTDACISTAIATGGAIAAMPCCYFQTARDAPKAVRDTLGAELSADIHRTYRLEAAGYAVDWSQIPAAITPMNRILVGWDPVARARGQ
jgi:hypothetical protein